MKDLKFHDEQRELARKRGLDPSDVPLFDSREEEMAARKRTQEGIKRALDNWTSTPSLDNVAGSVDRETKIRVVQVMFEFQLPRIKNYPEVDDATIQAGLPKLKRLLPGVPEEKLKLLWSVPPSRLSSFGGEGVIS